MLWLRHGRTAWNHAGRAQGHAQVPLDEVGRAQAAEVAPLVAAYRPVCIVASDLSRAVETASYVAAACALPVSYDERLREFAVGDNRMGLTTVEYADRFPEEYAHWRAGRMAAIPGRETTEQVVGRFVPAVEEHAAGLRPGECGVVVSHGAALRVGLGAFLGWPDELLPSIAGLDNCGWIELEESASSFHPGRARWRLVRYNAGAAGTLISDTSSPDFSDVARGR